MSDIHTTRPYRLSFADFALISMRLYLESLLRPFLLVLQIVVLGGLPIYVNRYALMHGGFGGLISTWMLIIVVMYVVLPPLVALVGWLKIARLPISKGERTVSISAEQLSGHGDTYDMALKWTGLTRVRRGFGQILFQTRPDAAVVVPVSAFASPAEADAFYDAAQGFFSAAKSSGEAAAKSTLDAKT